VPAPVAVQHGRTAAERLMTDVWRITRVDPDRIGEVDPNTGLSPTLVVYGPDVAPHHGKGKLQTYDGYETAADLAGAAVTLQRSTLHLPWGAYRVTPGDLAECLESVDPLLVGRKFRMAKALPVKTHATAYRVDVEELVR
jgi:hypothetical protein